jgi:hypothetical protein
MDTATAGNHGTMEERTMIDRSISQWLWRMERGTYPPVSGASVDDDPDTTGDDTADDSSDDQNVPSTDAGAKPLDGITPEQQKAIDKLVGDARREGRKAGADAARADAERKRAEEEGKFRELYESAQAELAKIKPEADALTEKVTALEQAVNAYLEPIIQTLPPMSQKMIQRFDILERIEFLSEDGDGEIAAAQQGTKKRQRVEPSNVRGRTEKPQPLGQSEIRRQSGRIVQRVKERQGNQAG